jgi:hypothetical protein
MMEGSPVLEIGYPYWAQANLKIVSRELQVSILRLGKTVRELNWGTLTIEFVILIVGISVGLQVNEWENRRNDRQLEKEYLERLLVDLTETERVLKQDFENLSESVKTLSAGISPLGKSSLTREDHQKVFLSAGASALVGQFGVVFGTVEELKDTGNMRLLRSKELRIALANLYQSYQQTIRISEMRNLLRSQSFPVLARQLKPNSENRIMWDEESVEQNKRDIYVALTVIQQNQKYDLADTEELMDRVAAISGIITQELAAK